MGESNIMPFLEAPSLASDHKFKNFYIHKAKAFPVSSRPFFCMTLWCPALFLSDESQKGLQLSHHVLFLQLFTQV